MIIIICKVTFQKEIITSEVLPSNSKPSFINE